jgi:hypothetical protein
MSSTEIILIGAVFAFAGFRLYQKYAKKDADKSGKTGKVFKIEKGSSFPSHTDGDDYEPYSEK